MKIKFKDIFKSSVKFVLPDNCPDEIIDYHVEQFNLSLKRIIIKAKKILKIK